MFDGILTATRYTDILSAALLPFIQKVYRGVLYKDNDPEHTSRYIEEYFQENNVNCQRSPAESPNLNLTELNWGHQIDMYILYKQTNCLLTR